MIDLLQPQTLPQAIIIFLVFTLVIGLSGTRLARVADTIADLTGWGEALMGSIFLGAVTSLSGIVTSVTAAWQDHPHLSVSNAIGGIAAQTLFLAFADAVYKKANLEHASASYSNLMQTVLLIIMLVFVLFVIFTPAFTILFIHPASILLFLIYLQGQRMIAKAEKAPMWKAVKTRETKEDIPEEENLKKYNIKTESLKFVLFAAIISVSGYFVADSAVVIAGETGLTESVVGALFTAVSTSLPELVVSISAVRQKSLTLAVSNIIGGNSFDVLFVAFSDIFYLKGSIYHHIGQGQKYIISLTLLLTGILLLGLLHRQKKGLYKMGWESTLMIITFVLGYILLFFIR